VLLAVQVLLDDVNNADPAQVRARVRVSVKAWARVSVWVMTYTTLKP